MTSVTRRAELSPSECWEVLSTARVGRVLYTVEALPAAQPVRFVVRQKLIYFSLDPRSAARIMLPGVPFAALQVDDLSNDAVAGRSVTVYGEAGFVDYDQVEVVQRLGLPGHDDEAVYACLVPILVDGTRVDLTTRRGVGRRARGWALFTLGWSRSRLGRSAEPVGR
jgi:uncharacterized protein